MTLPPAATFAACGAVVAVAGAALARFGDAIADRTGLGRAFVGALLVAAATSLPELATDIAAVRQGSPDLAVGDLFGSGMANMLILALADLWPGARALRRVATGHATLASLAVGLTAAAALFLVAGARLAVAGVGAGTLAVGAAYVVGLASVRRNHAEGMPPAAEGAATSGPTLRAAVAAFAAAAGAIVLAAPVFARSARRVAEGTGLGSSFVGAILLGFTTSLPELASTVAAVRRRSYDLAVGNLFGSNAFNMALLLVVDVANPGGPLLAAASEAHLATALVVVVMTSVGLAGIVRPRTGGKNPLVPTGILLAVIYAAGVGLLATRR